MPLAQARAGRSIDPGGDLPPAPWAEVPVLRYGGDERQVRMLCGYIQCEAMDFSPFRDTLPKFIHVRTRSAIGDDWLAQTIRQIVVEVDNPLRGGVSVLERLTEVAFMEVLRRQFLTDDVPEIGWLAAVRDPSLGHCLSLIHAEPGRDWSLAELARASGLSRSALGDHFAKCLGMSPIRYLRDWRLVSRQREAQTGRQGAGGRRARGGLWNRGGVQPRLRPAFRQPSRGMAAGQGSLARAAARRLPSGYCEA